MDVKDILLAKYRPELQDTEGAAAPSSIVDIKKSVLPDLYAFDKFGDWLAAVEICTAGWPENLRQAVIDQVLKGYIKE